MYKNSGDGVATSMSSKSELAGKGLLIVEDDPGIRETLKFALELEGHTVFTASDGKEGLEILATIPKPCLILLDLMMPVMNGWEFAEVIEKDEILSSIPVVVLTAFADKAKTIRAQGVIIKPVDLDLLSKTINHWCGDPTEHQ